MSDQYGDERKAFDEFVQSAEGARSQASDIRDQIGYIADKAVEIKNANDKLMLAGADPQVLESGVAMARDMTQRLLQLSNDLGFRRTSVVSLVSNTTAFGYTTFGTTTSLDLPIDPPPFLTIGCPFIESNPANAYFQKLADLDLALGKTYREAFSSLYGGAFDGPRSALFGLRQTYDHLFDLLGPDDLVKESEFWKEKDGTEKGKVHRIERYRYAANRWVNDVERRLVLVESAKGVMESYGRLNLLHHRGELSNDKAKQAFLPVDGVIKTWVDSIDPWPPKVGK